ncbi:MAG: hydroxymethylglutaryl-CoA reductase [Planctomycetes bacterium]|nr:hydroxymethylglutaryl-CoA reductase [Planctomycetota bacterium]
MSTHDHMLNSYQDCRIHTRNVLEWEERLKSKGEYSSPKIFRRLPIEVLGEHWKHIFIPPKSREALMDAQSLAHRRLYRHNIENFIGTVKVPVGLAGPLRVKGLFANGDYYIPMATTEAALVASYNRGSKLINEAGGCTAVLLAERVSRAPGFAFKDLLEVQQFVSWATSQFEEFKRVAESTTRYGKLIDMKVMVEGNHVYLNFGFTTGDASGQNMVTIATEAICNYIRTNSPVNPQYAFVEANFSGDKKANAQSFQQVRGKKVTAEVILSADLVEKRLHTTPVQMAHLWRLAAIGGILSGTIGIHAHYANALAALYIACGQDAACVAESAVGVTRFEVTEQEELYAAVTLPNLMVGTVGGGTCLPSQKACLEILRMAGSGNAQAFAEICAAVCLAGEVSIAGSICSGHFVRAHELLARDRKELSKSEPHRAR